jgi:putative tricarboxylic transport membrane protein
VDLLHNLILGFSISLSPQNLLYCFFGVLIGTAVGVLPGLGPVASIALLLPVTFRMDMTSAIIMLSGIYYGTMYGGSITSILVNIPGEAASIVTCIDGYKMARQGRAGPALGIAAFGSFIAGTIGIILLMCLAPPLASIAVRFGAPEYFSMMLLGLTLVTYLSRQSMVKGLMAAILGLVLGVIGLDPITAFPRFTFGSLNLQDGLNLAPMAMGLFGLAEVLSSVETPEEKLTFLQKPSSILPTRQDWRDSKWPILRGTFLGFFLGIPPGGGGVIASFASYIVEKRFSRHPEKFGTGAIEGVAGPESANNSAVAGAYIPLLTLGLPTNAVMALLLGALMIHGVQPGPVMYQEHARVFWGVITSMYIGNVMLLILNVPLIALFISILRIPYSYLASLIMVFCFVGAYSINNNIFDVVAMTFFGLVGYLLRKSGLDAAPLLLAFVLGPVMETSLRQSLTISNGSGMIFLSRPISAAFLLLAVVLLSKPALRIINQYRKSIQAVISRKRI